jgi:nucleoside-diphosphate-sugar epimerase
VVGSLEDTPAVEAACRDVDAVVHMAALTHARTDDEYERGQRSRNGAAAGRHAIGCPPARRFVYLSSLAAVGPCVDGRGVGRDDDRARSLRTDEASWRGSA